ncbi:class I SAM-dependent methyltransferase [Corallococcus sp. EGB]|uniref:class I SAM-dependent methyltransferase n=1 Tax=Corallococcus sp. EGB TaxID=1521117 RepID=UPI001CBDBF47|nr:class I SAM-dependent methyltransferase [Corallococcus sp. EGB]
MDATRPPDDEQSQLWNGPAGRAWVETQEVLDGMFKPIEDLLVEAVMAGSASQVLDIGCGTGSTTLAVARRLGSKGHCTGVDISEPMLDAARARAEREGTPARFVRANAQLHAFEPAHYDMIISRFGVMFFEDPVQAFANLRRASRADGRLLAIAWRSPSDNPFMTTAERAAAPLLPDLPARKPGAPGQFGFADGSRVHRILEDSGWTGIDIRPVDVTCTLPEKELVHYLSRFGVLSRYLPTVDERTRARIIETVRAAFEPFVHGPEVRYTAACWSIGARAPAGQGR